MLHDVGTARINVTVTGRSRELAPVLFVHGWPLHGYTWRKIVPRVSMERTCVVVDLPGMGETEWDDKNDFGFRGQAENLKKLLDVLNLDVVDVVAQDTGATIARQLALTTSGRVRRSVLINTEMPGHRPPWIETYQWQTRLPGARAVFRLSLRSRAYLRSSMAFGGCFCDKDLIDGEFRDNFVRPLLADPRRLEGAIRYLQGIDWQLVDGLRTEHAKLNDVTLVWGVDDPTFPIDEARRMLPQFASARLVEIPGTKLLPHEEKPDLVADAVLAAVAST